MKNYLHDQSITRAAFPTNIMKWWRYREPPSFFSENMSQPSGLSFELKHVGKFYWPRVNVLHTQHMKQLGRSFVIRPLLNTNMQRYARILLVGSVSSNQGSELAAQLK